MDTSVDATYSDTVFNDIIFVMNVSIGVFGTLLFYFLIIDNQRIWRLYRLLAK